jgi:hypothetical protein
VLLFQTELNQESHFSFSALLYPAVDSNQVHLGVPLEDYMCGMTVTLELITPLMATSEIVFITLRTRWMFWDIKLFNLSHSKWCFANHSYCGGCRCASSVRQFGKARELHYSFNTTISGINVCV